jgi:hypothetical protein
MSTNRGEMEKHAYPCHTRILSKPVTICPTFQRVKVLQMNENENGTLKSIVHRSSLGEEEENVLACDGDPMGTTCFSEGSGKADLLLLCEKGKRIKLKALHRKCQEESFLLSQFH